MKLVVGLGNPGREYEPTKHNVGFWVIDAFSEKHKINLLEKTASSQIGRSRWQTPSQEIDVLLAKPETFMNRSGKAVQKLLEKFNISLADLIVIADDLDMECGRVRIRTKGRAGGHRGMASIIEAIGSDRFLRIKIGIGRDPQQEVVDYVLTPFSKKEKKQVQEGVERAVEALALLLEGAVTEAMNRYNNP